MIVFRTNPARICHRFDTARHHSTTIGIVRSDVIVETIACNSGCSVTHFTLNTLYNVSFLDFYFAVAIPTMARQVISHSSMQWIISLYSRSALQTFTPHHRIDRPKRLSPKCCNRPPDR